MTNNQSIIIVRYENDPELFKKSITEISKLAKVYIYDNSKVGMEFDDENIYYFHDETNGGLARAINHVVDVALVDGKELAVYFDQDSSIDISMIQNLFESYDKLKEKYTELFVVGPQPTMPDGGNYPIKLGENFDARIMAHIEKDEPVKARRITWVRRMMPLYKAAASVAIILTLGNAAQSSFRREATVENDYNYENYQDSYNDPEMAYNQISDALQMVSQSLSEASKQDSLLQMQPKETQKEQ